MGRPVLEKIVIIIPTFNEADVIAETVHGIFRHLACLSGFNVHVLVFDSHSPDGTAWRVKELQSQYPHLHLAGEAEKTGLGGAYIKAMPYAMDVLKADIVIEYDADGSHQPQFIEPMLTLLSQGYDVVMGSRYVPGGGIQDDWPWHRKALSVMGNGIARLFLTNQYKDFTSGFRITRATYLKKIDLAQLLSKQYAYKIHLLWALHQCGAKIVEHPILFLDRKKGYSKFPRNNIVDSLRVVLALRLRKMKRYLSMCLVGFMGMLLQLLIFNLLRHFFGITSSNAMAIECAICSNFIMNNYFTFNDRKFYWRSQLNFIKNMLKFNSFSFISLTFQLTITYIGSQLWSLNLLTENILVLLGICAGSIINYYLYSKIIWKHAGHVALLD